MKNKLIPIIISVSILILLIIGALFITNKNSQKKLNNYPQVQKDIVASTKNKSFDVQIKDKLENITGKLSNQKFQGTKKASGSSEQIIAIGDKAYSKTDESSQWKEDDTQNGKLNLILHPDWIQIQKRLEDEKLSGKSYIAYEIIYEKPNQEILTRMDKNLLDSLRLTGSILVDKETSFLKKMTLHKGKDMDDSITVEYSKLEQNIEITLPVD